MNMVVDPRMMAQDESEPVDNADEEMLEQVRMGMGNQEGASPWQRYEMARPRRRPASTHG